jgi:endonuclease/exonuclease/phosphatase family metal-dependent hydrolase
VTFNVQHARRPDGVVDATLLAEVCASFDADVLALQEVDDATVRSGGVNQAATVAERCGLSYVFGEAIPRYGNALLARGEITDVEMLALPHTPDREPRSAIVARACDASVAATHLGLRGDATLQLPRVVGALLARPGPHLLLGDLNLERDAVDAGALELVDAGPTFPSDRPRRRIDHVAVSGLAVSRVAVLPEPPLSDHRPLLVELSP